MTGEPVIDLIELSMPWVGLDPFLMTVHHVDSYPAGNEHQGPAASLAGRSLGMDFSYMGGWSMYHGDVVPGFPQHPHRGFETVTIVRRGFVDHSDSLGATARYGEGDVQWLTTGSGIMHAEMFPLIQTERHNPLELFQIWLNLPPASKMVPAYFAMLWNEEIPTLDVGDGVSVDIICGRHDGADAPSPPPDSWASQPGSDMAIWLIRVPAGAGWQVPAAASGLNRTLYCFEGGEVTVGGGTGLARDTAARLRSDVAATIDNPGGPAELLLLQGRPIGAPVIQLGPFVMNTASEIQQAVADYRRTQFGGWPWSSASPVHDRSMGRFAVHADGEIEHRQIPATVEG